MRLLGRKNSPPPAPSPKIYSREISLQAHKYFKSSSKVIPTVYHLKMSYKYYFCEVVFITQREKI